VQEEQLQFQQTKAQEAQEALRHLLDFQQQVVMEVVQVLVEQAMLIILVLEAEMEGLHLQAEEQELEEMLLV
jgi:hypothetical protein